LVQRILSANGALGSAQGNEDGLEPCGGVLLAQFEDAAFQLVECPRDGGWGLLGGRAGFVAQAGDPGIHFAKQVRAGVAADDDAFEGRGEVVLPVALTEPIPLE